MTNYAALTSEELNNLANSEDKHALFEIAMRFKKEKNNAEYRKFLIFASQLGHGKACVELGSLFEEEQNSEKAIEFYKKGFMRGEMEIACTLSSLMMDTDEQYAVDILLTAATTGNQSSIAMLEEYYNDIGDDKEAKYWRAKRTNIKK